MEKYLYLLQCSDGSFYSEITKDLENSISNHIEGIDPEHFTYTRRPVKLVFYEKIQNQEDDLKMEKSFHELTRKKKLELLSIVRKPVSDLE